MEDQMEVVREIHINGEVVQEQVNGEVVELINGEFVQEQINGDFEQEQINGELVQEQMNGEVVHKQITDKIEVRYFVGDLLWAKIGCHPFWPCMVSYDPLEGIYTKKKKVGIREHRIYHVQYFGEKVQHGWTTNLILPFEGEKKFDDYRMNMVNSASTAITKRKLDAMYRVLPSSYNLWKIAVKEAEFALSVNVRERYHSFVFKYEIDWKKPGTIGKATKRSKSQRSKSGKLIKKARVASEIEEELCMLCETGVANLNCSGFCLRSYHNKCLGILCDPVDFKCRDCEQGYLTCFVCKEAGTISRKCSKCDYYYHEHCIKKFPSADWEKSICSFHACLTCCNENPNNKKLSKGPFVRCFRCPTLFHATEDCIPVGSVRLTPSLIHCPDHFVGKQHDSLQPTSNVPYCMNCSEGGELICCEACPASYHRYCIDQEVPDGDFICEDCSRKRHFYVGMVIWAKTGLYRWWPAHIVSLKDLPLNIQNLERSNGEFPIQYYGTDEYYWTHRGRIIPYQEYHKDFDHGSGSKSIDKQFKLSLQQAAAAYDNYVSKRQLEKLHGKPAYKPIKVNHAVPPATIQVSDAKCFSPCLCNPWKPNPCSSDNCMNRQMLMECHPDVCLAGDFCENQKFQRRQYAQVKVIKTKNCGWGLKAQQFIPKGAFVIEYVGEIITHKEYRRRITKMREDNIPNYYFLYIDSQRMIDAGPKGNLARFINHSCSPNCQMEKWLVKGDSRIGIFALTNILPGTELTFNYQCDNSESIEQKCRCGAPQCQGVIGKSNDKSNGKNGDKSNGKNGYKSNGKNGYKLNGKNDDKPKRKKRKIM